MGRGIMVLNCRWMMSLSVAEGGSRLLELERWFCVSHSCGKRCSHLTSCDKRTATCLFIRRESTHIPYK